MTVVLYSMLLILAFFHIRICNCDQLADDRPLKTSASCANIFLGEMFPIDAVGH